MEIIKDEMYWKDMKWDTILLFVIVKKLISRPHRFRRMECWEGGSEISGKKQKK